MNLWLLSLWLGLLHFFLHQYLYSTNKTPHQGQSLMGLFFGMSKSISRVLYWTVIYLHCMSPHSSSHLWDCRVNIISLIRCCIRWGLHAGLITQPAVSSYLAFSPLPRIWAVIFCCTFLRVASTGISPAPCPAMPGLSSYTAFRHCTRDCLTYSLN